jgi:anti-sigma-K factor RskA
VLSSKDTYQLWAVVHGEPISLGLMGPSPYDVAFTLAGVPNPTTLAITVEPAGGSVAPTAPLAATGTA